MIWFILGVLAGIIILVREILKTKKEQVEYKEKVKAQPNTYHWRPNSYAEAVSTGIAAILLGGLGVGMILSLLAGIIVYDGQLPSQEDVYEIVSVKDNSYVEGRLFLGIGNIAEEPNYTFYIKEGDGYIMQTRSVEGVVVIEDQEPGAGYFLDYVNDSELRLWGIADSTQPKDELHVPEGTVIKNVFDLDLE